MEPPNISDPVGTSRVGVAPPSTGTVVAPSLLKKV